MTAATPWQRTRAQAGWETRLLLRNGEQLLLTIVIPVGLLLGLTLTSVIVQASGPTRVPQALATVVCVSVISASFTSLAIATAFERRSGALRFLGTTPLSRSELLGGKVLATVIVTAVSLLIVSIVALLVGWRPVSGSAWAIPCVIVGMATFGAWGMALAGLLRAEAVLAVANGVFLVLILFGGVVIPASSLPVPMSTLARALPSGALADALSAALVDGSAPSLMSTAVLLAWLAAGTLVATRAFRWS